MYQPNYYGYYYKPKRKKRKPRNNAYFFSRSGRPKKGLEEFILKKVPYIPIWKREEWLRTNPLPLFLPKTTRYIFSKRKWKGLVTSRGLVYQKQGGINLEWYFELIKSNLSRISAIIMVTLT